MAVRTLMSDILVGMIPGGKGMERGGGGADQGPGGTGGGEAGAGTGNQGGAGAGIERGVEVETRRGARGPGAGAEREDGRKEKEEKVLELKEEMGSRSRRNPRTVVTTISMGTTTTRELMLSRRRWRVREGPRRKCRRRGR